MENQIETQKEELIKDPDVLTPEEVAKFLHLSGVKNLRRKVNELANQRKLPAKKVGRAWLFSRKRILAWIEDGEEANFIDPRRVKGRAA